MASIHKRPDGRWRARFRDPATGKEHAAHKRTRAEAQQWLNEQTAAVVRGDYVDPRAGTVTVGDYAARWLAGRVHLKPKTLASYESLLRTRVLPRWRDVPLNRVTFEDVSTWVAGMAFEGLSASRTRQAYHLLTSMLDEAVKGARLPRNPPRASTCRDCRPRNAAT